MSVSPRKRYQILHRDGFKCQYCGRTKNDTVLEVDHIEPKSKGGSDDSENLITSCRECNRGKYTDDVVVSERATATGASVPTCDHCTCLAESADQIEDAAIHLCRSCAEFQSECDERQGKLFAYKDIMTSIARHFVEHYRATFQDQTDEQVAREAFLDAASMAFRLAAKNEATDA